MKGKLLIAHPLLNDGFFNRSVIYVVNDNHEGAFGFCMNFKTQFKLRDVRPQVKNGNFPIFDGGPVAKDQLFFLHTLGEEVGNSMHISENIYFGGDFFEMLHHIEHGRVKQEDVRFFAGYSGWSEGQMEDEMMAGHWISGDNRNGNLLQISYSELWKRKLEEKKDSYGLFAEIGFDPSLN